MHRAPQFFALLLASSTLRAGTPVEFPNSNFDEGIAGWRIKSNNVTVTAAEEAAFEGNLGLRVEDRDPVEGSEVVSPLFPVIPGHRYVLTFQGKSDAQPPAAGVFIWHYDADKKFIQQKNAPAVLLGAGDGQWRSYNLQFTIPEGVAHAALWVHSLSTAQGIFDFDLFQIEDEGPAE